MNDFFRSPFCKKNMVYFLTWFFFLFMSSCLIIMLVQYVEINKLTNPKVVIFVFSSGTLFLLSIISRCICIRADSTDPVHIDDNNFLTYNTV